MKSRTSVARAVTPAQPIKPAKSQVVNPTAVRPRTMRAPQQFGGVASGTGSRVPESAIKGMAQDMGMKPAEASFQQHYGVITPVATEDFNVSQLQGNKNQNISYTSGFHRGTDTAVPIGTDVRSVKEGGVVKFSGDSGAYGNRVIIEYPDGTQAALSHLSESSVTPGQRVEKGEVVGKSGNTGHTTGPHLDTEAIKDGVASAPDKVWNQTSVMGSSAFGSSWKGSESGVGDRSAVVGETPTGGGVVNASGEDLGSRSTSFSSGIAASGIMGQQVNLGSLNQFSMRKPSKAKAFGSAIPSIDTIRNPSTQTSNPGTTTSIKSS
jgi:murein DD-endopeptidase MepM/ murein hydrolase activator NlpD